MKVRKKLYKSCTINSKALIILGHLRANKDLRQHLGSVTNN